MTGNRRAHDTARVFLGHFGLGLAGKRLAPRLSLGSLFLAVQFADLLFWVLTLVGAEHFRISPGATRVTPMDFFDYPYSHSLFALVVWGLVVGSIYWIARKSLAGAIVLAVGVVSHWVLDVVVHRRDMPLGLHGPYLGLELWRSLPLTLVLEAVVFFAGHRRLPERDARAGRGRRLGVLGARRLPRRGLARERPRSAAAVRARRRVGGYRDVALRPVGLVDRPAPGRPRRRSRRDEADGRGALRRHRRHGPPQQRRLPAVPGVGAPEVLADDARLVRFLGHRLRRRADRDRLPIVRLDGRGPRDRRARLADGALVLRLLLHGARRGRPARRRGEDDAGRVRLEHAEQEAALRGEAPRDRGVRGRGTKRK